MVKIIKQRLLQKVLLKKTAGLIPHRPKHYGFVCDNIAKPVVAIETPTKNNNSPTYLSATLTHRLPAVVYRHIELLTQQN